jgi:hypothetical protein
MDMKDFRSAVRVRVRDKTWMTAVLSAAAVWAGVRHSWIGPGVAALAAGQAVMLVGWTRIGRGYESSVTPLASLILTNLGVAYLFALLAGRTPEGWRFWLLFFVYGAIAAPVLALAVHLFRRS